MDEARANVGLNPLDPQKDIIEPYYSNWTSPITREEAMNTDMDWVDLVTRMGHFHDINVALNQGERTQRLTRLLITVLMSPV